MTQKRAVEERGNETQARVRRPEILATTVELVREHGLSNVRVVDVAERAGTSPTSVIYYFASKDELFEHAVADADAAFYATVRPQLEALDSGIDRLAWLFVCASASEWPLWMDMWSLARRNPEMRPAEVRFQQSWCAIIAEIIRHGQARGEFRAVDADDVAVRLAAVTNGLAVPLVLEQPGRTREHFVAMALRAAAVELGCEEAALRGAAARVPVPGAPPSPNSQGAA